MARRGNPVRANATAKSFMKTIKVKADCSGCCY
jgi:hypothetical protein